MRLWFIVFAVANLMVGLYGWYSTSLAAATTGPTPMEFDRDRIRLIPPDQARNALLDRANTCLEWGAFTVADAARAEQELASIGEGAQSRERRLEGGPRNWWVYLPPYPTRRVADRVGDDLKGLGADDFYVVQTQDDPKFVNAVSLGLFSTEKAAIARRDQLARLGVRGDITVQPRDGANTRVYLRLREVPSALMPRIVALRAKFSAAELRECAG
ncbi:MAG: SPOR domain-containing protein [Burkholderiales bacterium]